ncbi:MAG: hypothetical protein ACLQMO_04025 [Acidobacteriaceae bacterium]
MFCVKCAAEIPDSATIHLCPSCATEAGKKRQLISPQLAFGVFAVLFIVAVLIAILSDSNSQPDSSSNSQQQSAPQTASSGSNSQPASTSSQTSQQPESQNIQGSAQTPQQSAGVQSQSASAETADAVPEDSGDLLHPYDVLRNPFRDKGQMVTLNVLAFPILAEGMLEEYQSYDPRIAAQAGIKGLRFNRMLSENVALFDILALDSPDYQEPEMMGQLAVLIKSGDQPPDDTRSWKVEPLGVVDGTNGFGGAIQIPAVRFWGYGEFSGDHGRSQDVPELSGDSLTAVNLVREQVKPTDALLALNPDLNKTEWTALNNTAFCGSGCWYVDAHFRIHQESTDPVQYFENAGWQVNIDQHTVKPDPDAVKYFSLTGTLK